ncbi:MAG: 4,5-DOPA dioxygenase extradiol [Luteolibacter sp.]
MNLRDLESAVDLTPRTGRQPAIFIGHGSPMNIIRDNAFTRSLRELGERHGRPAAVLVISAHWLTRGETRVSVNPAPPTIHDFGGFPEELYRLRYPAPGQPLLAHGVMEEVKSIQLHEDHEMGLDHGAWGILHHIWPDAGVPVFQMSIDYDKPPGWHHELGKQLRRLRERGVLILGSGNVVHNLRRISWDESDPGVPSWALVFDAWVKDRLEQGDHTALFDYAKLGETARLAVPTNDHYLPMLYTLGAMLPGEEVKFTHESFQNGSISMRCFEAA